MEITLSKLLLTIFLFTIIKCKSEGVFFPKRDNLYVLSDLTYEEALKEHQYFFISAYAEWCSTCQRIEAELHKVANYFEKNLDSPDIVFGIIYGTYNIAFMEKYNIPGYPSLILFSGETKIKDYYENLNAESIIPWIRKIIYPTIQPINDELTFSYLIKNTDFSKLISYYGNDKKTIEVLEQSALSHNKYTFCRVLNKDLYKKYKVNNDDIVLYKQYDELNHTIKIPINFEKIEKFIDKYSHRLLKNFNIQNGRKRFSKKINLLLFISKNTNLIKEKELDKEREKICKEIRYKIQCVKSIYDKNEIERLKKSISQGKIQPKLNPYQPNYQTEDYDEEKQKISFILDLYNSLNLKDNNETEVFIIDLRDKINYAYNINDKTKIVDFVNKWYENKLINVTNITLPTSIKNNVISTNVNKFDKDVINNNFDIVVKFFAPWCGFCKKLSPIYQKLANFYSEKNKRLKFVEIDATVNEIPGIVIDAYPTIYLYKRNDKSHPILYNGDDTYGDISKFIDDNIKKK